MAVVSRVESDVLQSLFFQFCFQIDPLTIDIKSPHNTTVGAFDIEVWEWLVTGILRGFY